MIYRIPCECSACYIGQTKQKLSKRLSQHKNDCKITNMQRENKTALAVHHFNTGHKFSFEDTKILDIEPNWFKRNISEMYFIKKNETINFRTDVDNLNIVYSQLFELRQ